MADEYPPVLDAAMVAELLGMHIDTVRRLSRDGVLPAHRIPNGRTFRYLKDEVLDWLRAQPAHTADEDEPPSDEVGDEADTELDTPPDLRDQQG